MSKWFLEVGKNDFCKFFDEKTSEIFIWNGQLLEESRKAYVLSHKKYLGYMERCVKGSNKEVKTTAEFEYKRSSFIHFVNLQFHNFSKAVVDVALERGIQEIIVIRHNENELKYNRDSFGTYRLNWFYSKLTYQAKNAGIKLIYKNYDYLERLYVI